jgi:hypothetical protein
LRRARSVDLAEPLGTLFPRPAAAACRRHHSAQYCCTASTRHISDPPRLQRVDGHQGDRRAACTLDLARAADGDGRQASGDSDSANTLAFSVAAQIQRCPSKRGNQPTNARYLSRSTNLHGGNASRSDKAARTLNFARTADFQRHPAECGD